VLGAVPVVVGAIVVVGIVVDGFVVVGFCGVEVDGFMVDVEVEVDGSTVDVDVDVRIGLTKVVDVVVGPCGVGLSVVVGKEDEVVGEDKVRVVV